MGSPSQRDTFVWPLLAAGWLLSIVISYFILHGAQVGHLWSWFVRAAAPLIAVAGLAAVGAGLGTLLMPTVWLSHVSALERAALRLLLGLGTVAYAILGAGLSCWLPAAWPGWIITGGLAAALHRPFLNWFADLRSGLVAAFARPSDPVIRYLRTGVLLMIAMALLMALAPPVANDSLIYHMSGPARYAASGCIRAVTISPNLGSPQLAEMLYTWMVALGVGNGASVIHGLFGWAILLLVLGAAHRLTSTDAGWWASVAMISSLTLWWEMSVEYSDLNQAAYVLAAFWLLMDLPRQTGRQWVRSLIWAGCMTGLALGSKYTSPAYAVGLGIVTLWIERADTRRMLLAALVLIGLSALVFAPWPIRNAIQYGNPLIPLIGPVPGFEQGYFGQESQGSSLQPLGIGFAPIFATVFGQEGVAPFGSDLGPVWLALLPLGLLHWRKQSSSVRCLVVAALIFSSVIILIWQVGIAQIVGFVESRYLFILLPIWGLIGGMGLVRMREKPELRGYQLAASAAILIVLVYAIGNAGIRFARLNVLPYLAGVEDEDAFLLDQMPLFYDAMLAIEDLPDTAQVAMLWEWREYYCLDRCLPDSFYIRWLAALRHTRNSAEISRRWQAEGITHVLVSRHRAETLIENNPFADLTPDDLAALDAFLETQAEQVWQDPYGGYQLYRLKPFE